MRELIFVAGAGEKINETMVPYTLTKAAHRRGDKITFLRYDNSIGPVNSTPGVDWSTGLAHALADGQAELIARIRRTPHVPILIGYSLGAFVISELLEKIAAGQHRDLEIDRAVLIANPRAGVEAGRVGIAGAHGRYPRGMRLYGISNYDDLICRTPLGSVLRKVPNIVAAATSEPTQWTPEKWATWLTESLMKHNYLPTLADLALAEGYFTGAHSYQYFDRKVLRDAAVRAVG